ncbi:PREDICTED: seipin isoform X1 [Rhagoletis zephyria]|uniref:seipin isoform X1 n=2 Tax=Rhagoletis zephyria TaxID=28612 RepID=UPI0008115067|nr:PREDICTED: seipin isoform X1 [Rhagoletis zephyria]XP_017483446.1 PREDICTED: seipin isoform X1 [Rhagoletis zephyria]
MNFLIRFIIFLLDPSGLVRRLLVRPAVQIGYNIYDDIKSRADEKVGSLKELVLRVGLVAFAVVLIIWIAVFMYVAFYYTYMPAISHTRPVHMQFKSCLDSATPCTFPHAHVSLTKKQQLLMVGQAYRVVVQIEMPETPQNLEFGMFMVCGEMRDNNALLRGQSCRSAMMRYRSPLIRAITTWVLSPLFVLGLKEEFQRVPVEIFANYLEERQHPITDVFVEIQSQKIQFYTVSLHIVADFTGLRYIMYNWPILSAVVAISTNLFFILVIFLLSWYHWSDTTWLHNLRKKYGRITETLQSKTSKAIASKSGFRDDEDLSFLDDKSNGSEIEEMGGSSDSRRSSKEELIGSKPRKDNEEQQLLLRRVQ